MTLCLWMDENGRWRVSHFPPRDNSPYVMVALNGNASFISMPEGEEIEVEVTLGR